MGKKHIIWNQSKKEVVQLKLEGTLSNKGSLSLVNLALKQGISLIKACNNF